MENNLPSVDEKMLNILITEGRGHLFSLSEREIIFRAMQEYASLLVGKKDNEISWQLCPKCHGDGNLSRYNSPTLSTTTCPLCDVCNGAKILPTPLPPKEHLNNTFYEEEYVNQLQSQLAQRDKEIEGLKEMVEDLKHTVNSYSASSKKFLEQRDHYKALLERIPSELNLFVLNYGGFENQDLLTELVLKLARLQDDLSKKIREYQSIKTQTP